MSTFGTNITAVTFWNFILFKKECDVSPDAFVLMHFLHLRFYDLHDVIYINCFSHHIVKWRKV